MKRLIAWIIFGTLVLISRSVPATLIQSFTSGAGNWQAWTVNDGGGMAEIIPTYASTGGNSEGFISVNVNRNDQGSRLYGLQPADTTGFGDATGLALTVDFTATGTIHMPSTPLVRFYIGSRTGGNNYFVSNDAFSWNPNLDSHWTTHQVNLAAANFLRWPNCDANSKTFAQVIAAPEDIGLVFTGDSSHFSSIAYLGFASLNGASIGIDNFGVVARGAVPEPSTLLLLLSTLVCGNYWVKQSNV